MYYFPSNLYFQLASWLVGAAQRSAAVGAEFCWFWRCKKTCCIFNRCPSSGCQMNKVRAGAADQDEKPPAEFNMFSSFNTRQLKHHNTEDNWCLSRTFFTVVWLFKTPNDLIYQESNRCDASVGNYTSVSCQTKYVQCTFSSVLKSSWKSPKLQCHGYCGTKAASIQSQYPQCWVGTEDQDFSPQLSWSWICVCVSGSSASIRSTSTVRRHWLKDEGSPQRRWRLPAVSTACPQTEQRFTRLVPWFWHVFVFLWSVFLSLICAAESATRGARWASSTPLRFHFKTRVFVWAELQSQTKLKHSSGRRSLFSNCVGAAWQ